MCRVSLVLEARSQNWEMATNKKKYGDGLILTFHTLTFQNELFYCSVTLMNLLLSVRAFVLLQLGLDHVTQSLALASDYLHQISEQPRVASLSCHDKLLSILTNVGL